MVMDEKGSGLGSLKLALVLYVLVFALKLATYFVTGVMALLAEALHTLSDIFITGFLYVATVFSGKKADEVHMFGYGRAQNVASLVAATLFVSMTSLRLLEEAIPRLSSPHEAVYGNLWLAFGVIVVSMVMAAVPLISTFRQKERGATAKALILELLQDELGLLAALIGTFFIFWGYPLADPITAIIVATIIALSAIALFRENLCFLLGKAPPKEILERIEREALSVEGAKSIHDLRAEYIGPDTIHAGMHVVVGRGLAIEEANAIASEVQKRISESVHCGYCVVRIDAEK
jgi:cation diffusion facilitator family transporter